MWKINFQMQKSEKLLKGAKRSVQERANFVEQAKSSPLTNCFFQSLFIKK